MKMRTLTILCATAALLVAPGLTAVSGAAAPSAGVTSKQANPPSGSLALRGAGAAAYKVPSDMRMLHTSRTPGGGTVTRYQQYADGASVFDGQLTVFRNSAGSQTAVIGAHYANLQAKNSVALTKAEAKRVVSGAIGTAGAWSNTLRLDPSSGRLFYQVESMRTDSRPVRWVDARSGAVMKAYNAIAHGDGTGVLGDEKEFESELVDGTYQLRSFDDNGVATPGDAARVTLDAQNKKSGTGPVMTDSDDHWDLAVRDYLSPDQRVGVDAHTYAGVVDGYYASTFGRNSIDDQGLEIRSVVHYSRHYCNAFWNGVQMTYGDGDNKGCLPLSGGLDVVAHELTHGVTEFTSGLVYQDEPGALNEAFSDIMGNTIELQNAGLTPYTDSWHLAEGVYAGGGFRNMADPQEFGDPDHYSELYTGTADSGGVHSNSGIANHAYYLLVNGGKNAGCGGSASGHTHTLDCNVTVPGIGLAPAQRIFYDGFTALSENSNFCDARNSTVAVSGAFSANVDAAWDAVGVHEGCTTAPPPPAPCATDTAVSSTPFESTHPYRDESDCTWTYTNATPGFQFHFSLLDTERNYDYVYVEDADGNVLKAYTGTYKRGATSPCITGTVGKVHLVSDPFVTGQGFTVDSVAPC